MPVSTIFEEEVARQRYCSLSELRNKLNLDWLARKNYRVIESRAEFDLAIHEASQYEIWGVDTETTGLMICSLSKANPIKDTLAGICISWKRDQGIYLPLAHTQFSNLNKKYVLRKLRHLLETKTIVTHNGLYDGKVFYDEGIRLNIKQDTLLLYFNIDSNVSRGSKGLKPLTEKRYNYQVIEFSDIFASSNDYGLFRYLPKDLVCAYACADSDHTLQLFLDSFTYLTPGQRASYSLDILVQNELIRSEYYGKGVDMELCRTLNEINNKDLEKLALAIQRYAHYLICKNKHIPYKPGSYQFNLGSSADVAILFYDLLGYEITKRNDETGAPSVDKFVIKALLRDKNAKDEMDEFETELLQDIEYSALTDCTTIVFEKGEDDILVEAKKYKAYKNKLPFLLSVWRRLEKFRTSFFAPLLNNNFEGKYYSSISMTRTQTARLIDPIQTMVGSLKKLIVPYDTETQYLIDYDFAQIEYRCMAGLAKVKWLVERLCDPEADYHREGGSMVVNKAPEDITDDERSGLKSVNFGIPYGMSDKGICENRYGIGLSQEEFDKRLVEIQGLLVRWEAGLHEIKTMLDNYRDIACVQLPDSELPMPLKGRKISRLANPLGRTRVFPLDTFKGDELEPSDFASIRRQAGNYPIQSYAREVFCLAFVNLCNRMKREGLMDVLVEDDSCDSGYRFENKVVIIAYIHDECLMNVDKTVNPNLVHKMVLEECMQKIEGHPNYYCGINVITNWYEGKSAMFEAPVDFVKEISQKIDEGTNEPYDPSCNQRDWVLAQIKDWIRRRGIREITKFLPNFMENQVLDLDKIRPKFKNYFIKPKLKAFYGLWRETIKPVESAKPGEDPPKPQKFKNAYTKHLNEVLGETASIDDFTRNLLETFALELFPEVTVIYETGYVTKISRAMRTKEYTFDFFAVKEDWADREAELKETTDEFDSLAPNNAESEFGTGMLGDDSEAVKQLREALVKDGSGLTNLFSMIKEDTEHPTMLKI